MSRSVPEWIGRTPDTPIPPRVKVRVYDRYDGRCYLTGVKLRPGHWQLEHVKALINGGEHRESNLAPVAVKPHKAKSAADVAEKSKVYEMRKKDIGVKPKRQGFRGWRKFNGTLVYKDTP